MTDYTLIIIMLSFLTLITGIQLFTLKLTINNKAEIICVKNKINTMWTYLYNCIK